MSTPLRTFEIIIDVFTDEPKEIIEVLEEDFRVRTNIIDDTPIYNLHVREVPNA